MFSIFKKEIRSFLSSLIAYVVIIVFLTAIGLFMWILPSTNTLDFGYADLNTLFEMGPWVFIFLVSAITMRSFSEEKKQGTIETLTTRPVSDLSIITGKYLAGIVLVVFALLPTLLYYYTVHQLGFPKGNIDAGAMWGSYIGLLLIGAVFVSIGIFSSVVTENPIVSFILSMFICFFMYWLLDEISTLALFGKIDFYIQWLSLRHHYGSISRGVLDSRDVIYFFSVILLFISLTKTIFGSRKW